MIGFRVDANEIIATGHLMRCISIAEQVRANGQQAIFFMAESKCTELLESHGFEYEVLNSNWQDMENELSILLSLIEKYKLDWLVVDSYQITENYIASLQKRIPVLGIDIPEDRQFKISAILNYSHLNDAEKLHDLYQDRPTIIYDGLMFAPLRQQFFRQNEKHDNVGKQNNSDNQNDSNNQIMITTGGTDSNHIALKLTKELLKDSRFASHKICVVLGRLCEDRDAIASLESDTILNNESNKKDTIKNKRIQILQNVENMAGLMRQSKVCFSAGGSTSIELCACQTPAVVFSFVDNQIPFSEILNQYGAIKYIGDYRDDGEKLITNASNAIYDLISSEYASDEMKEKMASICDGKGAKRIADFLTYSSTNNEACIQFRVPSKEDASLIYNWRMEKIARKASLNQTKFTFEQHKEWFDRILANRDCLLLVGKINEQDIGYFRIDIKGNCGEISYCIDKKCRGKGFGSLIVKQGMRYAKKDCKVRTFEAEVKNLNLISQRVFVKNGFIEEKYEDENLIKFVKYLGE